MTTVSTHTLSNPLIGQIARKYGPPVIKAMFRAPGDGGNVPALYHTLKDARADGWKAQQLVRVFDATWDVDAEAAKQIRSDIDVLSMAQMEASPARDQYRRKAQARGYTL